MSVPDINAVQAFSSLTQPQSKQQTETVGGVATPSTGKTSDPQTGQDAAGKAIDPIKLQKGIDKLNQILAPSQTKVEMAQDTPPNQIWLNVVDSTTGQVIEKLPPEGLRQFMETHNAKGLALDMRL